MKKWGAEKWPERLDELISDWIKLTSQQKVTPNEHLRSEEMVGPWMVEDWSVVQETYSADVVVLVGWSEEVNLSAMGEMNSADQNQYIKYEQNL
jgi:hypothetical protein